MATDYTVGDTIYHKFTTRAFATGIPTTLSGTPVLSAYEDASTTQITAGVSVTADLDSVTGLNLVTIVATGANGFESGKQYGIVITTGTVGGVSVVGETVFNFTLEKSAAAVDLANGTDGLGAIKTETAAILVDTGTTLDGKIDTIDTNVDAILVDTADMQPKLGSPAGADMSADIAAIKAETALIVVDTNELQADWTNGGRLDLIIDAILVDTGTTLDGKIDTIDGIVDSILVDTADMQPKIGAPASDLSADIAAVKVDTAATLVDTAEIGTAGAGLTDLGGMSTAMKAEINTEMVDVITVDAISEIAQGVPSATPNLADAVMLMYMALRNKIDVTATLKEIHNDAGTVICKKTLSDDGTTYSEAELITGP